MDFGLSSQRSSEPVLSESQGGGLGDLDDLPPGGVALVLLLAGSVAVWVSGFAPGEPVFLVGAGLFGAGMLIFSWAGFLLRTEGLSNASDFLLTVDEEEKTTSSDTGNGGSEPNRTPPISENQKNDLIFGRADQECEWCGNHLDNPEVHHIEPRSEGGPNEPDNLIVLCPTCHRKADSGGISRTKLQGKLDHLLN